MEEVRFVDAELHYGCHGREFELSATGGPLVIFGPNGSGKSSLLEGLVRTLFGFNRRQGDDSEMHETRRPWGGDEFRGRLRLLCRGGEERSIERDFESAEVRILDPDGEELWRGDGNPGASNQEAIEYRERLRRMFGLAELADYERTACAHQGELVETRLGDELLQAAAGGRINTEEALEAIRERYRELTLAPIVDGARGGHKRRELEELRARIEEVESRLEGVRRAERQRRPLVKKEAGLVERLSRLGERIELLESAHENLSRQDGLKAKRERIRSRVRSLEQLERKLSRARELAESAREAARKYEGEAPYPGDFLARAAVIEQLREQRDEQVGRREHLRRQLEGRARPPLGGLVVAAVVAAGGVSLLAAGFGAVGGVVVILGLAGLAAAGWRYQERRGRIDGRRADLQRIDGEIVATDDRIARQLEGVPGVEDPDRVDLEARRRQFEDRKRARQGLEAADTRLAELCADVDAELRREGGGEPPESAGRLLDALRQRIGELRDAQATAAIQLEGADVPDLPEDVAATVGDVAAALRRARTERKELEEERDQVRGELLERGRPATSASALEHELATLGERQSEVEARATVLKEAYHLVRDADEQFREQDQQRLVELVSRHLAVVSAGALGPLTDAPELRQVKIHAFGREAPLRYRPLSYGQFHTALLAIRLGAADFLAHADIRVPLLVDEPFANLDDRHDRAVWESLQTVAAERQVIVSTQERSVLERLGIEPGILLDRADPAVAPPSGAG